MEILGRYINRAEWITIEEDAKDEVANRIVEH